MRVIGITGGVGAGKSAILSHIQEHYNCRVFLADEAAHQVEEKGQPCYDRLVKLLGEDILAEDKTIHRQRMAEKIFSDPALLSQVNAMIHPAVKERILEVIREEKRALIHDFLIIEAALLIEQGYLEIVDEMWYVYASDEVRRKRLRETRGYSDLKIDSIMEKQLGEKKFRHYCHVVIDNDSSLPDACGQVDQILREYLKQDQE